MSQQPHQQPDAASVAAVAPFTPVPVRERHNGWTPHRQIAFIQALAETACVTEACRHVGMSTRSAYALKHLPDAGSFRQAWDLALIQGAGQVADAAFGRAIHGVAQPIFYKGEQIGERRVFNERLTQFVLRNALPERFGAWRDRTTCAQAHPDRTIILLTEALKRLSHDAIRWQSEFPIPERPPLPIAAMDVAHDEEEMRELSATVHLRDMEITMLRNEIKRLGGETHEDDDSAANGA